MNCKKCGKVAVVHLTERVVGSDGGKRWVEIHLCLEHAIEIGWVAAENGAAAKPGNVEPVVFKAPAMKTLNPSQPEKPAAIVPTTPAAPGGLSLVRKEATVVRPADLQACPACGMTWQQFKQTGQMGCPNDYALFAARLAPVIRRTQESFLQHVGKVPASIRQSERGRSLAAARLRRELQQALESENYELAAHLRDQLKALEPAG
jgi:hypothetical protein